MEAKVYTQKESRINGYGVWLYLIATPMGNIFWLEYEGQGMLLHQKLFLDDLEAAEKEYERVCTALVKGKFRNNGTV